ncbi:hypothetical protein D9M68_806430 [compost metagenome]
MCVGGKKGFVVLHDDHVAVGAQLAPHVHHTAVGRGHDGVAEVARDVQALVAHAVEAAHGGAGGGADEERLARRRPRDAWNRLLRRRGAGRGAGGNAPSHEQRGGGSENKSLKVHDAVGTDSLRRVPSKADISVSAARTMLANSHRRALQQPLHLSGIGVPRSTGTAVTLFLGEPSISRSE